MIFQSVEFSDYAWIIGLVLMFSLSLIINTLLEGNYKMLMLLFLGWNGVVVLAGLLAPWTLILMMIFTVAIIVLDNTRGESG